MVTNDKIMMSSVLQILKNLVFKSSVLIIPQIMLIFSLQENTESPYKRSCEVKKNVIAT